MKANQLLDEYNCFSSNISNTKHTLYFDKNIHRPAILLQNSVFGLKIIDGFGDCGVLAILFSILSGGSTIQKKNGENVYDSIHNFDKDFKLKEPVIGIFQIKYFRQALFHAKIYANSTDDQKYSNMIDLSDFIGNNNIYKMKDKIVKLHNNKNDVEKQLIRTPKPNDKEQIKNNLHRSIKNVMIYIRNTTTMLNLNL